MVVISIVSNFLYYTLLESQSDCSTTSEYCKASKPPKNNKGKKAALDAPALMLPPSCKTSWGPGAFLDDAPHRSEGALHTVQCTPTIDRATDVAF